MTYPNVCPDCNGHFDPGHTCPPTSSGNRIRTLERQLADERARIDCATRGGWLSEDLECAGEDGPACWKHLLAEAQGKLDAVKEVREVIHRKNLTAWHVGQMLAHILKEEK